MGKYTHMSMSYRRQFYTLLEMKLPISEIAQRLCKHRSTLYRELIAESYLVRPKITSPHVVYLRYKF